jgi:thioesterase domain-containing protein
VTGTAGNGRLITIVRRGDRPTCVMLPGGGGGLSPYLRLAAHVARTYNVYAVLPTGVLPDELPEHGLPAMADTVTHTLTEARLVPQLVFGWSFGGVLAWEVCTRLAEHGHQPDVVIVDSSPLPLSSTVDEDERIQRQIIEQLGPRPEPEVAARVASTFQSQVDALRQHRVDRAYHGRVLVQMCRPWDTEHTVAALLRWRELADNITTGTLDASHFEVFDQDHLPQLTAAIDDFLASTRTVIR